MARNNGGAEPAGNGPGPDAGTASAGNVREASAARLAAFAWLAGTIIIWLVVSLRVGSPQSPPASVVVTVLLFLGGAVCQSFLEGKADSGGTRTVE